MLGFTASYAVVLATMLGATVASAQQADPAAPALAPLPSAAASPPPPPPTTTAPSPAMDLAPALVAAPQPTPESDHDALVHHLAVGYFGTSLLPIAVPPSSMGLPPTGGTVTAPAVGIRYWFSRRLGLDAALGIGFSEGSASVNSATGSAPTSFGLDVHAGLPIALVSSSHYVFEVVPEALIGFTTGSIPGGGGVPDQTVGGFLLNVGARFGAEIHFGFIGIPQLALQGSVGIYYSHQSFSWSQPGSTASVQSNSLATSVQASPWAIFTDNLSALYYF
jgi:hypothetical protein